MAEVRWSKPVERRAFRLSDHARVDLMRVVSFLRDHPEIGEAVREGRFRGMRRIPIDPGWFLYYRVVGRDRTCHLMALRHSRQRPV